MKLNNSGITMVEIIVVIILMGTMVVLWAMNRKPQLEMAYQLEATVLLNHIEDRQKVVYAANSVYSNAKSENGVGILGDGIEEIDAQRNLYFRDFIVTNANALGYTAIAIAADDSDAAGMTFARVYNRAGEQEKERKEEEKEKDKG